jgi:uncharacterized delta-60 repeat protein
MVSDSRGVDLVHRSDGKLVIAGSVDAGSDSRPGVFRVDPDGQLDSAFGNSGRVVLDLGAIGFGSFHAAAAAVGGRTIAAGERTDTDVAIVAQFLDDGTLDAAFAGGVVEYDTNDARVTWWDDIAVQADGRIVLVGTAYDYPSEIVVARYH